MTRLSTLQSPVLAFTLSAVLASACGGSHNSRGHSDGGTGGEAGSSPGGTGGEAAASGGSGATGGVSGSGATGGTGTAGTSAAGGTAGQASGGSAGTSGAGGSAGTSGGAGGTGGVLLCGNGMLDLGETCDPSIPVSQADVTSGGAGGATGAGGSAGGSAGAGTSGAAGASTGGAGGAGTGGAGTGGSSNTGGTAGSSTGGASSGGASTGGASTGGASSGGTAGSATGGAAGTGGDLPFGQCVTLAQCPAPAAACMQAVLTGSPEHCDVACAEAPITACVNNDGCCAPGCSPSEDNDCQGWSCHPDAPLDSTRYTTMEALSKDALRTALLARVSGHTSLGYDGARNYMFNTLDVHAGELECIYTGRLVPPDGTRTPGGFNTEHSWPQSMGASSEPAHSDLHHLFPTDGSANSARSNWPFGDTTCVANACPYYNGGSERGTDTSGATVWEVRAARRGDVARAMFYFSVRYALPLDSAQETALRAWHCQDPPDDVERDRNDGIDAVQHNRNPFIDRPDFVDRLLDF